MEQSFEHNETELKALVDRFEAMLRNNGSYFFDVEDFEDIIDYYIDNQDNIRSKKAIDLAEAQHPGSTAFMIRKARYFVMANKANKAISLLEEIEKIDPTNGDVYLLKGSIFSKLKKFDDAIREYNKAILYAGDLEEVYNNIAYEYENAGDYVKAIEFLKKILDINPENESAIFELSFCYEITNELEKSVEYLTEFLNKNPYSRVAWFNIGITYNNLELYEKAIEA
ncbi:MAG: tetratricopeptide repeat protein, partial [Bacteroidales bacterium]|nr:tetratricopeptide repeat protein [Bacteroidales bacterium]